MQIRAAVLEEFGKPLVVQEVGLDGPRAGEVLVRLEACGARALEQVNEAFELMHRQDGIRTVLTFD